MTTRTTITNWAAALAAIALGLVAQGYFSRQEVSDALLLYAVGAALFMWATRGYGELFIAQPGTTESQDAIAGPDTAAKDRLRWAGAAMFGLAVVLVILALREFNLESHLSRGWTFYLLAMGTCIASAYVSALGEGYAFRLRRLRSFLTRRELVLLLMILGIGALMRFYRFGDWPYGTWYDEADNALQVLTMMVEPAYRPVFVPSTNLPAHFLYLILASFRLFGPTTEAIRMVTAMMGMATIVAAYLFGRELLGRQMGLVLAYLIAVSRWNVTFSRIGLHGISTPLFELLVMYALLHGLRTRSRVDFAWAGLLTGLGLCFYAPFRLFPFVIILFLLHWMVIEGRSFWRHHAINIVVMGSVALIAFSPVIQYAREHSEAFWARTDKVSIFKTAPEGEVLPALLKNTAAHLLMFNLKGDPNGRHNLPGEPMLDYVTSALGVFGLIYALTRVRHPRMFMLFIWFVVMLCGGIFSLPFEAPQSLRAIGTLAVAYVLACLPLASVRLETLKVYRHRGRWVFLALLVPLLVWIGWSNYHTYFRLQARNASSWLAYSTVETVMSEEINRLDPGYQMYFAEVLTNHLTTRYLAPRAREQMPFDPAKHLPFQHPGEKGVAVFLDKDSLGTVDLLRFYYPEADVQHFRPPFGGPEYLALIRIDRDQILSIQGLPARYYHEGGDMASSVYRQDETIRFQWPEEAPMDFPFHAEWRGVLAVPAYGQYGFRILGSSQGKAEVRLDGAPLLGGTQPMQREIVMARGRHDLHIQVNVDKAGLFEVQWRAPAFDGGESAWATIPREALFGPPVTANGLLATFYPNAEWQSPPELARIDPEIDFYFHLIPLQRPYTAEWTGDLDVPVSGRYVFGIEVRDAAYLFIDGKQVLVNQKPDAYYEAGVDLEVGRHDIRLRYLDQTDHSHVYLYWITPGGIRDIIPYRHLTPHVGAGWEPVD